MHLVFIIRTSNIFDQTVSVVVLDVVECHVHCISDEEVGQSFWIKVCDRNNLENIATVSRILHAARYLLVASVNEFNIVPLWDYVNSTNKFIQFILKEAFNISAIEVGLLFVFSKVVGFAIYTKEQSFVSSKAKFTWLIHFSLFSPWSLFYKPFTRQLSSVNNLQIRYFYDL